MLFELIDRDPTKAPLVGCPVVEVDAIHVCRHHEEVRFKLARKQFAGQIFVDHRFDAAKRARAIRRIGGWDSAPASANDNRPFLQHPFDRS